MNGMSYKTIFFDFQYSGHHVEYVDHLIRTLPIGAESNTYFAIPEELRKRLNSPNDKINFIQLPEFHSPVGHSLFIEQSKWIIYVAKKINCNSVFFLNLDPYQYVIGTKWFMLSGLKVAGILFSPHHRIEADNTDGFKEKVKQSLRKNVRKYQLKWMLRNPNFYKAFILDDPEVEKIVGKKYIDKIAYLPDPIDTSNKIKGDSLKFRKMYGLTEDCICLLSFGAIVPRKNILNIIDALPSINDVKIGLVVLGKGDSGFVNTLRKAAKRVEDVTPHRIAIINKYVPSEETEFAFASTDIVLAVYKAFFCSSGVIGHAAKYRKPILATSKGIINYSVSSYSMGETTGVNTKEIEAGLKKLLFGGFNSRSAKYEDYLMQKTVENFGNAIFSIFN